MSRGRRHEALWCAAIGLTLTAITVVIAASGPAGLPARHAYILPVVAAALRFGLVGGALTSVSAALLHAPFVLPQIEWIGFTELAGESLASFVTFLIVGTLTGTLTDRARRDRSRYETALAVQRALGDSAPLETALDRLRLALREGLRMTDVGLLVVEGDRTVSSGPIPAGEMARVLRATTARFTADIGGHPRPRRQLVAPLVIRGETVGILSVERIGEMGSDERTAVVTIAAHAGLALENARLVSGHRRFAEELAERVECATRQLQALDRAKSAFVATASHELRTPLTALLGFSELLATRAFTPDEVSRLAGVVHRETERLVRIVDDLLDLSRLERGLAPTLHRTAVEVAPALLGAVEMFRRQQVAHHFEIDCADGVPPIDADPDALDRILKNLITNALKYSRPGLVNVRAHAVGGDVEFQIEDRGRGIPAEALSRLFEPYYRVPDGAGVARGTGLGLAIVKSLIEAHGGSVSVSSAPGVGTRVTFTLPRSNCCNEVREAATVVARPASTESP